MTSTCETPLTIEMRGAITFSSSSSTTDIGSVREVTARNMMGSSAGLVLRNDGAVGIVDGRSGMTSAIAVWTSTAALSMSRPRSN
jgi:hypothetical protein